MREKNDLIQWVNIICYRCTWHKHVFVLKAFVWNWVNKNEKDFQKKNSSEDASNNNYLNYKKNSFDESSDINSFMLGPILAIATCLMSMLQGFRNNKLQLCCFLSKMVSQAEDRN